MLLKVENCHDLFLQMQVLELITFPNGMASTNNEGNRKNVIFPFYSYIIHVVQTLSHCFLY